MIVCRRRPEPLSCMDSYRKDWDKSWYMLQQCPDLRHIRNCVWLPTMKRRDWQSCRRGNNTIRLYLAWGHCSRTRGQLIPGAWNLPHPDLILQSHGDPTCATKLATWPASAHSLGQKVGDRGTQRTYEHQPNRWPLSRSPLMPWSPPPF